MLNLIFIMFFYSCYYHVSILKSKVFVLHNQLCNCIMFNQQIKYCGFEVTYKLIRDWAIGIIYLKHVFCELHVTIINK